MNGENMKSRWGGYKRGRSHVSTGRTVRNNTPTNPINLDYRDAAGIWNMRSVSQFPKVQNLTMAFNSHSFLGNAASVTTYTADIPTGARSGDFAVAFFNLNNTLSTMSTPTGWTLVTNTSAQQPQTYVFYKTLTAGDLNTSISGTGATATAYSSGIMTFNGGDDTFSFTAGSSVISSSSGTVSQTIPSSSGTGRVIAVGMICGNPTTQVNTLSTANAQVTLVCNSLTGMTAGNISMVYSIYNSDSTPLNVTIGTSNDAGRQACAGFYINCTLGT